MTQLITLTLAHVRGVKIEHTRVIWNGLARWYAQLSMCELIASNDNCVCECIIPCWVFIWGSKVNCIQCDPRLSGPRLSRPSIIRNSWRSENTLPPMRKRRGQWYFVSVVTSLVMSYGLQRGPDNWGCTVHMTLVLSNHKRNLNLPIVLQWWYPPILTAIL